MSPQPDRSYRRAWCWTPLNIKGWGEMRIAHYFLYVSLSLPRGKFLNPTLKYAYTRNYSPLLCRLFFESPLEFYCADFFLLSPF